MTHWSGISVFQECQYSPHSSFRPFVRRGPNWIDLLLVFCRCALRVSICFQTSMVSPSDPIGRLGLVPGLDVGQVIRLRPPSHPRSSRWGCFPLQTNSVFHDMGVPLVLLSSLNQVEGGTVSCAMSLMFHYTLIPGPWSMVPSFEVHRRCWPKSAGSSGSIAGKRAPIRDPKSV